MELHRFFRYAIEKMCKEKKSLNHFRINIVDFYNKVNSLANLVGCYYNKELIGLCVFYANNHDTQKAYITFLAVKKNFRGKNIAGEILKVACANAKN